MLTKINCLHLSLALYLFTAASFSAAQVSIEIMDQDGEPLEDTTILLQPLFQIAPSVPEDIQIEQVDEKFFPRVAVIQTGASVSFPNLDPIRHHVYSFSEAKQFDIPLYSGTPPEPIQFDRSGLIVLGCNIHDQMRGYILVSDSPYFGVSDSDGKLNIEIEHPGEYAVSIWHPEQESQPEPLQISIDESLNFSASYQITTANQFFPRRGSSGGSYF